MPSAVVPRSAVTPGAYLYRLPDWSEAYQVTVEEGQGAQWGRLTVRHCANSQGSLLDDIPAAAIFEPVH